jgi:hypothetical protein
VRTDVRSWHFCEERARRTRVRFRPLNGRSRASEPLRCLTLSGSRTARAPPPHAKGPPWAIRLARELRTILPSGTLAWRLGLWLFKLPSNRARPAGENITTLSGGVRCLRPAPAPKRRSWDGRSIAIGVNWKISESWSSIPIILRSCCLAARRVALVGPLGEVHIVLR